MKRKQTGIDYTRMALRHGLILGAFLLCFVMFLGFLIQESGKYNVVPEKLRSHTLAFQSPIRLTPCLS